MIINIIPLFLNNICQSNLCTQNELNNQICSINNTIIKTHWLTNIIAFKEKYRYGSFAINHKVIYLSNF